MLGVPLEGPGEVAVKVFISWSGERSRVAARELHEWLQLIMPTIEPWMSDTDLDKGSRWATGIGERLEEMSAGISVLTQENLSSEWLNFEAGAISKAFGEGRVMTFLLRPLCPTDVPHPLALFQATSRTREDVTKMIMNLNKLAGSPMKDRILAKQIQAWWPQLDDKLAEIENHAPAGVPPKRSTHDMLEEVLTLLRDLSRRPDPYVAAGGLIAGGPPSGLADVSALYRLEPASATLVRRGLLVRRASPLAAWVYKIVLDFMGRQAADKVDTYLDQDAQTVFIVSDLVFPEHILDQLRGLAKEVHFSVTVASTEEFERVRRVRKLGRLVHLPRDMSIESPDLDDD
jgi:hypothetical protein